MKKLKVLKKWLPRVSRKWRIACNLLISLLLLIFVWVILDSPLPTVVEFRRMESADLVGPSEVLAVVRAKDLHLDDIPEHFREYQSEATQERILGYMKKVKCVIGRQDDFLVWRYDTGAVGSSGSREISGEVNLWSVHTHWSSPIDAAGDDINTLAAKVVIVQTDLPEARHAKLEWKEYRGNPEAGYDSNWCSGTGEVQGDGIFVIPLFQSSDPIPDDEGIDGRFDLSGAHLVLTDANGEIIYDEILIVE